METEKLLLTPEEVGLALGITRASVFNLIKKNMLPSLKLGRSRRISKEALRQWIAQQSAAPMTSTEDGV